MHVAAHLKNLYVSSVRELPDEYKSSVAALLREYSDVFAASATDLGKTHLVQLVVDTGNIPPFQNVCVVSRTSKPRRLSNR